MPSFFDILSQGREIPTLTVSNPTLIPALSASLLPHFVPSSLLAQLHFQAFSLPVSCFFCLWILIFPFPLPLFWVIFCPLLLWWLSGFFLFYFFKLYILFSFNVCVCICIYILILSSNLVNLFDDLLYTYITWVRIRKFDFFFFLVQDVIVDLNKLGVRERKNGFALDFEKDNLIHPNFCVVC